MSSDLVSIIETISDIEHKCQLTDDTRELNRLKVRLFIEVTKQLEQCTGDKQDVIARKQKVLEQIMDKINLLHKNTGYIVQHRGGFQYHISEIEEIEKHIHEYISLLYVVDKKNKIAICIIGDKTETARRVKWAKSFDELYELRYKSDYANEYAIKHFGLELA